MREPPARKTASARLPTSRRSAGPYREAPVSLPYQFASQYNDPVRVVAFNISEGWSRDVSYEFAVELQRRANIDGRELTGTIAEFVEFYTRTR